MAEIKTDIKLDSATVSPKLQTNNLVLSSVVGRENKSTIFAALSTTSPDLNIDIDEQADVLLSNILDTQESVSTSLDRVAIGIGDVRVNGVSVVYRGVAHVTVPVNISELENDVGYVVEGDAGNYITLTETAGILSLGLYTKRGKQLSQVSFNRTKYLPGICIGIDQDNKISLLFDTQAFKVDQAGKLQLNTDYIATRDFVEEKIELINSELSIINNKLSIINTKIDSHTEQLSLLNNKVNDIELKLSSKVDKNLSTLPDAHPGLSIESQENLLVYLYNTKDSVASKAKLTELGYWDCENK